MKAWELARHAPLPTPCTRYERAVAHPPEVLNETASLDAPWLESKKPSNAWWLHNRRTPIP